MAPPDEKSEALASEVVRLLIEEATYIEPPALARSLRYASWRTEARGVVISTPPRSFALMGLLTHGPQEDTPQDLADVIVANLLEDAWEGEI